MYSYGTFFLSLTYSRLTSSCILIAHTQARSNRLYPSAYKLNVYGQLVSARWGAELQENVILLQMYLTVGADY